MRFMSNSRRTACSQQTTRPRLIGRSAAQARSAKASTLLLGAETGAPLGLIDQHWWVRLAGVRASDTKKTRAYEDKESFKRQQADQAARKRLGADWARVITVGDGETDITAYLS